MVFGIRSGIGLRVETMQPIGKPFLISNECQAKAPVFPIGFWSIKDQSGRPGIVRYVCKGSLGAREFNWAGIWVVVVEALGMESTAREGATGVESVASVAVLVAAAGVESEADWWVAIQWEEDMIESRWRGTERVWRRSSWNVTGTSFRRGP